MSKFYVWVDNPSDQITSETEFYTNSQRVSGFQSGTVISSRFVNSALRQANLVAAALMNAIEAPDEYNLRSDIADITRLLKQQVLSNLNLTNGGAVNSLRQKPQSASFEITDNVKSSVNKAYLFVLNEESTGACWFGNGSSITNSAETFSMGRNVCLNAPYTSVFGRANYIQQSNNHIHGSQQYIDGIYNFTGGQSFSVLGDKNLLAGASHTLTGSFSNITGNAHRNIFASYSSIHGDTHNVGSETKPVQYAMIFGNRCKVYNSYCSVGGNQQRIYSGDSFTADYVTAFGNYHQVGSSDGKMTDIDNVTGVSISNSSTGAAIFCSNNYNWQGANSILAGYLLHNYSNYNAIFGYKNKVASFADSAGVYENSGFNLCSGQNNIVKSSASVTCGENLINCHRNQILFGRFNDVMSNATRNDAPLFAVGYGTSDEDRKNVMTLTRSGKLNVSQLALNNVDIPTAPTTDGSYTLKCVVSSGVQTYQWVKD